MLGLGGGMLYVPIFHWLGFGLQSMVIPLGLLLNGLNTLLALIPYGRKHLVDWTGGLPMAFAALVFAPLGALAAPHLPNRVLLILFAAAVLVAAVRTLLAAGKADPSLEVTVDVARRVVEAPAAVGISGALGSGLPAPEVAS
jgi:hypothetical protein